MPNSANLQVFTGWHSRGYLPHLDQPGLIQHITFHLADSLPQSAISGMQEQVKLVPPANRDIKRLELIHNALDHGYGSCILRRPACAEIVELSLLFGDGTRYRLLEWCIMPNHVHVLIEQNDAWSLSKIIQSWKRHTARKINQMSDDLRQPISTDDTNHESVWQRDYFDRYMRDERHFNNVRSYIKLNPVNAGLAVRAEDWEWSSARLKCIAET